jgi:hypothetical protein
MAISLKHPNYREPTGMIAKYVTSGKKSAVIGNGACKSVATETFSRSPETIPGPRLMLAETSPMDSMNSRTTIARLLLAVNTHRRAPIPLENCKP